MWTEEEKAALIVAYEKKIPIQEIEILNKKTKIGLMREANALGLTELYPEFDYMVGQKFSYLTVIRKVSPTILPSGQSFTTYECLCDCGNVCKVLGTSLRKGDTKSCGCKKKELIGIAKKKRNHYDLTGEYGIGYDLHDREFYFDLEDYDLIKDYRWQVDSKTYYVFSTDSNRNYSKIKMHRLIMGLYPGNENIYVDHIHTERKNDNRKSNLRLATRSQNGMNMEKMPQNTSGVTGVSFKKDKGLWVAYITVNARRIWLGSSKDFNEAVELRKNAEKKYFGERSYAISQTIDID